MIVKFARPVNSFSQLGFKFNSGCAAKS